MKLKSLYMTKSLVNLLNLKHMLYMYKMSTDKVVNEQLDEFNKLILDPENIDVKLMMKIKLVLLYRRENLSLEEVHATLNSK